MTIHPKKNFRFRARGHFGAHPCFWPFWASDTTEVQLPLILVRFQRYELYFQSQDFMQRGSALNLAGDGRFDSPGKLQSFHWANSMEDCLMLLPVQQVSVLQHAPTICRYILSLSTLDPHPRLSCRPTFTVSVF